MTKNAPPSGIVPKSVTPTTLGCSISETAWASCRNRLATSGRLP